MLQTRVINYLGFTIHLEEKDRYWQAYGITNRVKTGVVIANTREQAIALCQLVILKIIADLNYDSPCILIQDNGKLLTGLNLLAREFFSTPCLIKLSQLFSFNGICELTRKYNEKEMILPYKKGKIIFDVIKFTTIKESFTLLRLKQAQGILSSQLTP